MFISTKSTEKGGKIEKNTVKYPEDPYLTGNLQINYQNNFWLITGNLEFYP